MHLSQIGYPVIGDLVYSSGKNKWGIEGQCLHAKRIEFKHPITGKEMKFEAKPPKYLQDLIEELEESNKTTY